MLGVSAGALILIGIVYFAVAGRGTGEAEPAPVSRSEAPAAFEPQRDTVDDVWIAYRRNPPKTERQYRILIERASALGAPGRTLLVEVARAFLEKIDPDDARVHEILGDREFSHRIPERIAFREYPYLRAVEAANQKHWFAADEQEELDLANRAWEETREHAIRLAEDHTFRAVDQARANIAQNRYVGSYNYATRWEEPYLICYSSNQRLSEYDLLSIPDRGRRREAIAALAERRKSFEAVLDEKATLFKQVYDEYLRRYGERLKLKGFMERYGGRPDYDVGRRSFQDGLPLIVWIFEDRKAYQEYHSKVVQDEWAAEFSAGYFDSTNGWIFLFDEERKDRAFEIDKSVHEAVHQLQFWFTAQRNSWRRDQEPANFLDEGLAEWIGSVRMDAYGSLTFTGVNAGHVEGMQAIHELLSKKGNGYPIFPLEALTAFGSYGDVIIWGHQTWGLDPLQSLQLFYQQSWAFVYFLNTFARGRYAARFEDLLDRTMRLETGYHMGSKPFRKAFGIEKKSHWETLDREFGGFVRSHILRLNARDYQYTPPPRGSLPR